ncbi:MAG: hypothetical protein PHW47_07195 [Lachnospira sp.]|nr:hypothetical protein [Lachnospira sp.]
MKTTQHGRNMKQYGKEYNRTKKNVLTEVAGHSQKAKYMLGAAMAASLILIFIVVTLFTRMTSDLTETEEFQGDATKAAAQIEQYANNGEYAALFDYCKEQNIAFQRTGPLSSYYPVIESAQQYSLIESTLDNIKEHKEYAYYQYQVLCTYLSKFYRLSYLSQYNNIEGAINEINAAILNQMITQLGKKLQEIYPVTDEDLASFPGMTSARIESILDLRSGKNEEVK